MITNLLLQCHMCPKKPGEIEVNPHHNTFPEGEGSCKIPVLGRALKRSRGPLAGALAGLLGLVAGLLFMAAPLAPARRSPFENEFKGGSKSRIQEMHLSASGA